MTDAAPLISVIMAAYRATETLVRAVDSVLAQTVSDIELVIVEDRSPDDTLALAHALAEKDARVRVIAREANGGPAAARNSGLEAARGTWVAVVDADDAIAPERFERMLQAADQHRVDIVFDNLLYVPSAKHEPSYPYLAADCGAFGALTLETYIRSHRQSDPLPNLGFTKPMIRRAFLEQHAIRYQTGLKIGEDALLVMELMASGARAWLLPDTLYHYFRREDSISFRQDAASVKAVNDALAGLRTRYAERLSAAEAAALTALMQDNYWRFHAKEIRQILAEKGFLAALRRAGPRRRALTFLLRLQAGRLLG